MIWMGIVLLLTFFVNYKFYFPLLNLEKIKFLKILQGDL